MKWDLVFRNEVATVFNFVYYRLCDRDAAEDLCAEVFERAWKRRRTYDGAKGSVRAWLIGIARRVIADRRRRVEWQPEGQQSVDVVTIVDQQRVGPESQALAEDEASRVRGAVAALPVREREIIAMKYGAGLSNREIARTMDLSESNVGTIVHRTIELLRRTMEDRIDENG